MINVLIYIYMDMICIVNYFNSSDQELLRDS